MSDKDRHLDLENHLNSRNEFLSNLYDAKSSEIPDAEKASLLPILTTLETSSERYQEVELIAKGGEKRITRVMDHRLNRHVAMARAVKAVSRQGQEQFLREARLEANLAHPNIVPVYNMGIDPDGVPFFTMELIPGDSLKTVINKLRNHDKDYLERYPLSVLLSMFLKICDAIAYAHSRQVIHLDIKPDNIRVGEFGEVYVCDWGLARVLHTDIESLDTGTLDGDILNDMTQTGMLKGTPGFMAPEQTDAHGEKTVRTDIYALGALLYNMLTYQLPVAGKSGNELIENTRCGKIIPPHARGKSLAIPKGLAAVALKALALDPDDRYSSASEIQEEIVRYLSGYPTRAEAASPFSQLGLLIQRHSKIASLTILFLILAFGIIGTYSLILQQKKAQLVAANRQALSAQQTAEQNLQLYQNKVQEALELNSDLRSSAINSANIKNFNDPLNRLPILNIALKNINDSDTKWKLLRDKAQQLFIVQRFNETIQCLEEFGAKWNMDHRMTELLELSRKYAPLKSSDDDLLSTKDLAHLLRESPNQSYIIHVYNAYMLTEPSLSAEEYLPLLKVILSLLNHGLKEPLDLQHKPEGLHLNLSGTRYTTFKSDPTLNVLTPLNLHSLDISHTQLLGLNELNRLKIKELRMVGLDLPKPYAVPYHLKNIGVEKLTIDLSRYPQNAQPRIRDAVELLEEIDP